MEYRIRQRSARFGISTIVALPFISFISVVAVANPPQEALIAIESRFNEGTERYGGATSLGLNDASLQTTKQAFINYYKTCLASSGADCLSRTQRGIAEYLAGAKLNTDLSQQLAGQSEEKKQIRYDIYQKQMPALRKCLGEARDEAAMINCSYKTMLGGANAIGAQKLRSNLRPLLGEAGLQSEPRVGQLEQQYQQCLNGSPVTQTGKEADAQLRETVRRCGVQLRTGATQLASSHAEKRLSRPDDSPAVRQAKQKLASGLDALAQAIPSDVDEAPSVNLQEAFDRVHEFIAYDPRNAESSMGAVIDEMNRPHATPELKRDSVLQKMGDSGMVDQMIKAMIQKEVISGLGQLRGEDRLPHAVSRELSDKSTIDRIFTRDALAEFRRVISRDVLAGLLTGQMTLESPALQNALAELKLRAARMLVNSDHFGGRIVRMRLNKAVGSYGYDWNRFRSTPQGKATERYIKTSLVLPKFLGEELSRSDIEHRTNEAKEMTKAAVLGSTYSPRMASSERGSRRSRMEFPSGTP